MRLENCFFFDLLFLVFMTKTQKHAANLVTDNDDLEIYKNFLNHTRNEPCQVNSEQCFSVVTQDYELKDIKRFDFRSNSFLFNSNFRIKFLTNLGSLNNDYFVLEINYFMSCFSIVIDSNISLNTCNDFENSLKKIFPFKFSIDLTIYQDLDRNLSLSLHQEISVYKNEKKIEESSNQTIYL